MTRTTTIVAIVLAGLVGIGAQAQLPDPGMAVDTGRTAVVITDPQNDFLSPDGVTWGLVGASVTANKTVENIESLIKAAKSVGMPVLISPHYYYPTDHGWQFGGAVETMMHSINMFDRTGALTMTGFEGSGADWLERYKPLIEDGKTVVVSPHKVYGPETNDLVLQLRKRGVDKVILAGMSANLCTESHLRELLEQGFEVAVVTDATAAAQTPEIDGYAAALTNFRFLANATWSTAQADMYSLRVPLFPCLYYSYHAGVHAAYRCSCRRRPRQGPAGRSPFLRGLRILPNANLLHGARPFRSVGGLEGAQEDHSTPLEALPPDAGCRCVTVGRAVAPIENNESPAGLGGYRRGGLRPGGIGVDQELRTYLSASAG